MGKITKIPSEIRNILSEKRINASMETFLCIMEGLHISNRDLGGEKRVNCQFSNIQIFQIVLLMPFFAIKGFSHYGTSVLARMFGGKKDILYDFMAQDNINWRSIVWRIASKLVTAVTIREDYKKTHLPAVLIGDDSDLPKTGMRMEKIGKIFSHVHQKCILGYKTLMLCWSDGRSQFVVDFSLHGEKGKKEGKEQGLDARQRARRFSRSRDGKSHIAMRMDEEYFESKLDRLKKMVKEAIRFKIPFDYLLVDSWFVCTPLVDFVCKCHKKFHLLGMAKMGNTKYVTGKGEMSAKAILNSLKDTKAKKYSRKYRCHYIAVDAVLGTRKIRLFFCRRGKNEGWKVLLTTDTSLNFLRTYEIYAMRWSIEVIFSDSKRLLGLADCSARNFSSQVSHVALVVIRYNLMAAVKRSCDYETIGGLFGDMYEGVHELTVIEKIWDIILGIIVVVAEMLNLDEDEVMAAIITDNRRLTAFQSLAQTA